MASEPAKRRPSMFQRALPDLIGYSIWIALSFATVGLLRTAGVGSSAEIPIQLLIAFPVTLMLGAGLVRGLLNMRGRRRGEPAVSLAMTFFHRGHRFSPMSRSEAEEEWARMHQLPLGGRLVTGRRCRDCPVFVLECLDTHGKSCTLIGGVELRPYLLWVAGLYVRSTIESVGSTIRKRSPGVFQRIGCRWEPMPPARLASELAKRTSGALTAAGWYCHDCSAIRLDLADEQDRPFLLGAGPDEARTEWWAGFVFGYGRTLPLPWPHPAATESLHSEQAARGSEDRRLRGGGP